MSAVTMLLPAYGDALRRFLAGAEELARTEVYALGRWALDAGEGLLPVLEAHQLAVAEALEWATMPRQEVLDKSAQLLTEAVSPFEMAYRGFREANEGLRALNDGLSREVEERSHALADGLRRLQVVDVERRRLLAHLVQAQESERRRIAAEIHDDSIQVVTALAMRLGMLAAKATDPATRSMAQESERTAQVAIARLRSLLFELRPPALEHNGLVPALQELRLRFRQDWDFEWSLESDLEEEPPVAVRIVLFRVAQEALTNARKHARATTVQVRVSGVDGGVRLEVVDDGAGFDPDDRGASRAGHLGLVSMRERVELASGWWEIESVPGAGTTVRAWVPTTEAVDDRDVPPGGPELPS